MNVRAWADNDEIRVHLEGSSTDRHGTFVEYEVGAVWNGGPYIDLFECGDFNSGPFDTICVWSSDEDRAVIEYTPDAAAAFLRMWLGSLIREKEIGGW